MDPRLDRGASPASSRPAEVLAWFARGAKPARGLGVHGIGVREEMPPGHVDRPAGTGDWLLMCFHRDVQLAPGAAPTPGPLLMLWSPAHGHWYGRDDAPWSHSWIHCDGPTVRRLVAGSGLPLGEPIAPVDPAGLERCLRDMHLEITTHDEPDEIVVENLLHNLLRHAARSARPASARIPPELIAVRRHLEAAFAEPIALADLARMAGCSVGHFCAAFKRSFGVTAIDYAITLRLGRARALLADRNVTVRAVARMVGYEDVRHFTKLYRKRMGTTPGMVRRSG